MGEFVHVPVRLWEKTLEINSALVFLLLQFCSNSLFWDLTNEEALLEESTALESPSDVGSFH